MERVSFDDAKRIIKERTDLADFFTRKGFDLKPSGASRYVTLCPFHNEKTPSFTISETRNNWKCYGCGKSGDVFTYLMDKEGLSFPDAVRQMADELGLELETRKGDAEQASRRSLLMEITAKTWEWFRSQYDALPEDHIVKKREIREKRGISSDAAESHYLFGWAPENGQLLIRYLRHLGYSNADMMAAGVISESSEDRSYYCPWRGRLMFPVCDVLGKPLGFVGRQVFYNEGEKIQRKYVNSRDSEVYHKRDLLFCQSIAREQAHREHTLFVVEGQFDVIAMQHAGLENTVASSGTALGQQQVQAMRRMVGPEGKVVFMFDADNAGQAAALKTLALLGPLQAQSYASITEGKDPSDMYREDGPDALRRQAKNSIELWRHVVTHLAAGYDLSRPDQRRSFLSAYGTRVWSTLTDPTVRDSATRLAALLSGSPYAMLIQQLEDSPAARTRNDDPFTDGDNDDGDGTTGGNIGPDGVVMVDRAVDILSPVPASVSTVSPSDGTDPRLTGPLVDSPAAAALLANVLDVPALRPLLEMVRMDGMDEDMRTVILAAGDSTIIPETFDVDTGDNNGDTAGGMGAGDDAALNARRREYLEHLDDVIDKMHELELAAPVPMDPCQLALQQVESLLKDRKQQRQQSLIAENIDAGQSADASVISAYDSAIRSGFDHINEVYERNLEKATRLAMELTGVVADHEHDAGNDENAGDSGEHSDNGEPYAVRLESYRRDKAQYADDAMVFDLVDPNEPVYSTTSVNDQTVADDVPDEIIDELINGDQRYSDDDYEELDGIDDYGYSADRMDDDTDGDIADTDGDSAASSVMTMAPAPAMGLALSSTASSSAANRDSYRDGGSSGFDDWDS